MSKRDRYYTYIFVDKEEPIYQAVQMAHVAMVIGQNLSPEFDARNIYFQVCKIPEDFTIKALAGFLLFKGFDLEFFYEPDVDKVIAIGTYPVRSDKRGILRTFDLLKF